MHTRIAEDHADTLTTFFEDVARIPVVGGKADYLPLTRRVHLGWVLLRLWAENPEDTFRHILSALDRSLQRLETLSARSLAMLDLRTLAAEVEFFLDNPSIKAPPALVPALGLFEELGDDVRDRAERAAWRVFHLLALLPPEQRRSHPDVVYCVATGQHWEHVLLDACEARQTLVSGSLRYVIRCARGALGRGLPFPDLVQEGCLGLLRAVEMYDERRGHWALYATQWIRQAISRGISEHRSLLRMPVHIQEELRRSYGPSLLSGTHGYPTSSTSHAESECSDNESIADEVVTLAGKRLRYYRQYIVPPYSLDCDELGVLCSTEDGESEEMPDLIVDEDDPEQVAEQVAMLDDVLATLLMGITGRNRQVLEMRFGFTDGEEYTLEEIGQRFGVTRERIRQIQAKEMKRLERLAECSSSVRSLAWYLTSGKRPRASYYAIRQQEQLSRAMDAHEREHLGPNETPDDVDATRIDALIQQYVEGAHSGLATTRPPGTRITLLRRALEEIGQPAHYTTIHERATKKLPAELQFAKERAYAVMFYSNRFQLLGDGVFGLTSWSTRSRDGGDPILSRCPAPLLPENATASAFFDSVMVGRELLERESLAVGDFWQRMQGWARRRVLSVHDSQDAFDAWYAVGLLERIEFAWQKGHLLSHQLPHDAGVAEVRRLCLDSLCQRVNRMPELLGVLGRYPHPRLPLIQRVLFGSEAAGHDIGVRLALLESFGAVRCSDGAWLLTAIGRELAAAFPAQDLPDVEKTAEPDGNGYEAGNGWGPADLGLLEL